MNNSKSTPATTFYSRKKEKFKYSEFKYQLRQQFIVLKERYDTPQSRYVLEILRDFAWQTLLITLIAWSLGYQKPLPTGFGVALLISVALSYLKEIVQTIKN